MCEGTQRILYRAGTAPSGSEIPESATDCSFVRWVSEASD